jgi:CRISPR-associated protein (TIGR02584 family)
MTWNASQHPSTFPRRALLCVAGLFPQVVTETLYALAVQLRPPFVPTEIHVVSTLEGIKRARLMLLSPDQDRFGQLCRDYRLEGIAFGEDRLHVLQGPQGALTDIRDEYDNEAAADYLTRLIAELTSDPDCALHVSIAGGRKTLGFYAGYALSLFGRPQDRLSHVLVNEPFEANPGFFYPPPDGRVLIVDQTRPVSTTEARIDLAMIPFVRLRHGLPPARLGGDLRFSEAVALADGRFGPPRLTIDLAGGHIECSGRRVTLSPLPLAVYAAVARRGAIGAPEIEAPGFGEEVLSLLAKASHADRWSPRLAKARARIRTSIRATTWFREHCSRANRSIEDSLGPAAHPFLIRSEGPRNRRRYSIAIEPGAVVLRDGD